MTNEEPTSLTAVLDCLAEFSHNCVPAGFTGLLRSAEAVKSIATMIAWLEDEEEVDTAAVALKRALQHFDSVVRESLSMYLLEDEDGAQTTAAQLARVLATPARRGNFLLALVGLSLAAVLGDALRRNQTSLSLWEEMIVTASTYPAVACFAPPIDIDALLNQHTSDVALLYDSWESRDFKVIDLEMPLRLLRLHAGALWLKLLQNGPDKAVIERTRQRLQRALYFLQSSPGERWILQPYKLIGPTDSLRGILNELLSHDLEFWPRRDDSKDRLIEQIFPTQSFLCKLTVGRIRKREYVILFPALRYFITEKNENLFKTAAEHPLRFVRDHIEDMSKSLGAQQTKKELERIEDLQNGEKLAAWAQTVTVGLTANAVSVALCNLLGLPSEARAFITVFTGSLILLIQRRSNSSASRT